MTEATISAAAHEIQRGYDLWQHNNAASPSPSDIVRHVETAAGIKLAPDTFELVADEYYNFSCSGLDSDPLAAARYIAAAIDRHTQGGEYNAEPASWTDFRTAAERVEALAGALRNQANTDNGSVGSDIWNAIDALDRAIDNEGLASGNMTRHTLTQHHLCDHPHNICTHQEDTMTASPSQYSDAKLAAEHAMNQRQHGHTGKWIVTVHSNDTGDHDTYGPYDQADAEALAAKIYNDNATYNGALDATATPLVNLPILLIAQGFERDLVEAQDGYDIGYNTAADSEPTA